MGIVRHQSGADRRPHSKRLVALVMLTTIGLMGAGRPDLETLRMQWDEFMLQGQGANVWFDVDSGKFSEVVPPEKRERLPTSKAGRLADAFTGKKGIVVGVPARQPLLLWRRDGWILSGGPLRHIRLADSATVELYGRSLTKEEGFYPPTRLHEEPPRKVVSIDFFLLRRPQPLNRARVLRTWTFTPSGSADPASIEYRVNGELAYDEASRTVSAILNGLEAPAPVVERIVVDEK